MIEMEKKFEIFREVAEVLNKKLGVVPVLYGSLGLSRLVKETITVNDIDILVPDEFVGEKWGELKNVIEELDFELSDVSEHEFIRNGQKVAFAEYNNLADVNLTIGDLKQSEENGISFYELNLEQYLAVYCYCLHDGYRQTKHADKEKIALIERYIIGS
ncbi:MAG: hypothetical protein HYT49_02435 [Candidatus Wildermuthbacteria bacterium]|nr:hypothetical protein [Candidatus Wildermuthbacteria bacterium]